MSPEQLLSAKHIDLRADLWALSVVAYFALTGRVPFIGETMGALAVTVNTGVFTLPSAIRPGLPSTIDAWMQRALQRDPAARFSSAKELAAALQVAAGSVARASMPSAGDLSASAPTVNAALIDTGGGSGRMSSSAGLGGSGAQGRSLAALEATSNDGRRRSPVLIAATITATIAAIGAGVFLLAPRAPADSGTLAAKAAASDAPAASSGSASIEERTPTIISVAAPTSASAAPPPADSTAPPVLATSPAPTPVTAKPLSRASAAPLPVRPTATPASKPERSKDTIGF